MSARTRDARGSARGSTGDLDEVLGGDLHAFCDRLYARRPDWASGGVSRHDARYLFERAVGARTSLAVEIGTASGVSTAFLCQALDVAGHLGPTRRTFSVESYDISTRFYADHSKRAGDATRHMLAPELMQHVTFRAPATAATIGQHHERDTIGFMFIDANHRHPWPALDLLASLDCLRPGAEVVLHDVNLPSRRSEAAQWGAKHLFDDLDADKALDQGDPAPNIGSVWVPQDKERFRGLLLEIVYAHEWEDDVGPEDMTLALAP